MAFSRDFLSEAQMGPSSNSVRPLGMLAILAVALTASVTLANDFQHTLEKTLFLIGARSTACPVKCQRYDIWLS